MNKKIDYYRKMRHTQRLSGQFRFRSYNLLEHSYMVTVLFRHFAKIEDVVYSMQTLDWVLNHDIVETVTADLVYPVKNYSEKTRQAWESIESEVLKDHPLLQRYSDEEVHEILSPLQYKLFKACDVLDLWIYCKEEKLLGNNSADNLKVISVCEGLLDKYSFDSIKKYMKTWEK